MTDTEIEETVSRCSRMLAAINDTPGKVTIGLEVAADLCRTVLKMAEAIHTLKDNLKRESRYRKGYIKQNNT